MSDSKKLLVFDALNAFYRAYIIDPSLTPNGDPVGGVRTFLRILQKEIKEERPDEVMIAWDGAGGSKRKKNMDSDYKEGRSPVSLNRSIDDMLTEDEKKKNMAWQRVRVTEYLNDMPIKQFMYDNVEADDVISYIVQSDEFEDWKKVVVSNDRDFIQLVNFDNTELKMPTSDLKFDEDGVLEEYDIHPKNFTLARAMVGDDSDNLDGVYGIGMKRAVKSFPFLSEEEDYYLEDVFEYCEENKGKYKAYEDVLSERKKVRKNYRMMQLYSPLLSSDVKKDIDSIIEDDPPSYERLSVREKMVKDDIVESNWQKLLSFCRRKQINEE